MEKGVQDPFGPLKTPIPVPHLLPGFQERFYEALTPNDLSNAKAAQLVSYPPCVKPTRSRLVATLKCQKLSICCIGQRMTC